MVDTGWTIAENSRWVPWPICGVDCNCNWLDINGCCQCAALVWDIDDSVYFECSTVLLACLLSSYIRITAFCSNTACNNVFHGRCRPSTIAALVTITTCAIYQLLLRKVISLARIDQSPWFRSGNCRKSPTRTAASLVFHTCHTTFRRPINIGIWNLVILINVFDLLLFLWDNDFWQESFLKLLIRVNGKLVDSHFVSLGRVSVVPLNDV